jgi:hypothetical protein
MSHIFVSYANEDRARIGVLVSALESTGWTVWWDRTILPSENYHNIIEKALDDATCVIVAWSHNSISSDWVKTEAEEGRRRGILVPVFLDDVKKVPLAFRSLQSANLSGWSGSPSDNEFQNLSRAVSRFVASHANSDSTQQAVGTAVSPKRIHRTARVLVPAGIVVLGMLVAVWNVTSRTTWYRQLLYRSSFDFDSSTIPNADTRSRLSSEVAHVFAYLEAIGFPMRKYKVQFVSDKSNYNINYEPKTHIAAIYWEWLYFPESIISASVEHALTLARPDLCNLNFDQFSQQDPSASHMLLTLYAALTDYFSASYRNNSKIGERFMEWSDKKYLRDLQNNLVFGGQTEPHAAGEVLGSIFWEMRGSQGIKETDLLLYQLWQEVSIKDLQHVARLGHKLAVLVRGHRGDVVANETRLMMKRRGIIVSSPAAESEPQATH